MNVIGNITITTIQPVAFSHHGIESLPMMTRGVDPAGQPQKTVFYPAAAVRGMLRHAIAFARLRASGKVTLMDAYRLALGQSADGKADSDDEIVRLDEIRVVREADPIIDLFGQWKIPSRLQVGNLMPAVNVQPDEFSFIRRDLDTNEQIFDLLPPAEQDAFYSRNDANSQASKVTDQIKAAKRAIMTAKKAGDTSLMAEIAKTIEQLEGARKVHKDAMGEVQNSTKHLVTTETIPAGIDLSGRLVIQRAKPRDISMLVTALESFSLSPQIGAHRARGMGEVEMSMSLSNSDGDVLVVVKAGGYQAASVQWTDEGLALCAPGTKQAA